jgi:hypothetical protein
MSVRIGAPGGVRIGLTLNDYARRPGPTHFQTVSMEQRRDYAREGVRSNEVARQRAMAETHPGRPGEARSLNMHEMARSSGGHLPGGAPAGRNTVAERGYENNRGVNPGAARPGTTGVRPGTPGATPGTAPRPGTAPSRSLIPGRTPPNNGKKPQDEKGGNNGGGRYLVLPSNNAAKLAGNVPADPKPADSKASASTPADSTATDTGTIPTANLPVYGNFGGLVPLYGSAATNVAPGAADAATDLPPENPKDPIRPLTLSPELSPQLTQFGANGSLLIRGQSEEGVSQFSPSSLLHQVGDPAARDSGTDPIRPLNLLPPTSLPLGNSRQGLPSAPGNPAGAVTGQQKDPIRPLRLIPPSGS